MAGLSKGDTDQTYPDIDFAIYLTGSVVWVYEAGTSKGSFGSYTTSDKFRVESAGSVIRYRKNGVVFYTSLLPARFPLLVDASINTTGLAVVGARIGQTSFGGEAGVTSPKARSRRRPPPAGTPERSPRDGSRGERATSIFPPWRRTSCGLRGSRTATPTRPRPTSTSPSS